MENITYENAVNEELCKIHRMVEIVKNDSEVGGMRIQILEENYELKQENIKLTEEKEKLAEEIAKLREELNRRTVMDKVADNS